MLSCRRSSPDDDNDIADRNDHSRRKSSAASVFEIMEECKNGDSVVSFPFVPYALSLSLSTAYLELKYSRVQTHQARAYRHTLGVVRQLDSIRNTSASAAFMADLARKALEKHNEYAATHDKGQNKAQPNMNYVTDDGPLTAQSEINSHTASHETGEGGVQDLDSFAPDWSLDELDACMQAFLDPAVPTSMNEFGNFAMY